MSLMREWIGQGSTAEGTMPGGLPGKRSRTEALPVQRLASGTAPASPAPTTPASAEALEDPFGLHLAPVQRLVVQARSTGEAEDPAQVTRAATAGIAGAGGALPHLDTIQRSFGHHDVRGVEAHTGGAAAAATSSMKAEAYAFGNHVAFGGAPSLHTAAHEAAHVVQQRAGVHLKGGVGEQGDPYEQHADAVADAVVQGRSAQGLLDRFAGPPGSHGGAVQRSAVQLLMSAHELERLAGKDRSNIIKRAASKAVDQGSKYDEIVGFLEEYEALAKKDPQLRQGTKRLEILQDIVAKCDKWADSDNRGQADSVKDRMKETQKAIALDKLRAEVVTEILRVRLAVAQAATGARPASKGKSTKGYTFSTDFRPKDVVGLSPQTLTVREMKLLNFVIDQAMEHESELRAAGVEPGQAMQEAYADLPVALRPKTAAPEEKLALMVKRELFHEAIVAEETKAKKKQAKKDGVEDHDPTIREQDLEQGKPAAVVGGVLDGAASAAATGAKVTTVTGAAMKQLSPDDKATIHNVAEATGLLSAISATFGLISLTYDFAQGDVRYLTSKDPARKALAWEAVYAYSVEATKGGVSLTAGITRALFAFQVLPIPGISQLVGALNDLIEIIQSIVKGAQDFQRLAKEEKLHVRAAAQGQGLDTAIGNLAARNQALGMREAANIVLHAVLGAFKVASGVAAIIADAAGGMGGASVALSLTASALTLALTGLQSAVIALQESYRSGTHQEAERQAEAGMEGSAKKAIGTSPTYATTALLLEAKKTPPNPIAVETVKHYGIDEHALATSTVTDLRALMLAKLEEKEGSKNLGQKAMDALYGAGIKDVRI